MMHKTVRLLFLSSLLFLLFLASANAQNDDSDYAMGLEVDTSDCVLPESDDIPQLLGGSRASSLVIQDVDLLSQPPYTDDTVPLPIIQIPEGAYVIVYDIDEQTRGYFRIVFPCDGVNMTGWVPVSSVRFPARRANPKPAPPGCAQAVEVVELLDGEWVSDYRGRVAVVADLFRTEEVLGELFPRSFYYLTRNGREIRDRERVFETSGMFLIRGSVLSTDISDGNRLGFSVITSSREDLEFFGILFRVPDACEFGE